MRAAIRRVLPNPSGRLPALRPARAVTMALLLLGVAQSGSGAEATGRIEKHPGFPSRFVAPREVDVWLPPGYAANAATRYPVIYAQDGQNLFDPATSYFGVPWSLDRAMLRLIAARRTAGAIIVGIWNTPARFSEYMPRAAAHGLVNFAVPGIPAVRAEALKSDDYLRFLVEELKPFIDRTYRTIGDASHTFLLGSSMGGLISAYGVVRHPEVFGGAACLSTHWPAGDGAAVDYFAQHLPAPRDHRFYFDYGTETLDAAYEPYQQRTNAALRAAGYVEGVSWITRKFPGAEHSEKSWRERAEIPLEFLLAPVRPDAGTGRSGISGPSGPR
jgi:enterochelin esterase-like enzyme